MEFVEARIKIPDEVVGRYAHKQSLDFSVAYALFEKLERFLDRAATTSSVPPHDVDAAWHEFILHTRLYQEFCLDRYGHFIHHCPTSPTCESGAVCRAERGTRIHLRHKITAAGPAMLESKNCRSCASECMGSP